MRKKLNASAYLIIALICSCSAFAEDSSELYEKALIAFQNQEMNVSRIHLLNILKQDPNNMTARLLLSQIFIEQGDGLAAEAELNKARSHSVDLERLSHLYAQAYLLQRKFDSVIEVAKKGNRSNRLEAELALYRGQAYLGKGKLRSAEKDFELALVKDPMNQLALLGRSQVAFVSGNYREAYEIIEESLAIDKSFSNGWIMKANILQKVARFDEAEVALNNALEVEPEHFSAHISMAALLIQTGRYDEANKHVDLIIEEIPNEPRAGFLKAIIAANTANQDNDNGRKRLTEVLTTLSAVSDDVMKATPDYYYLAGLTNYKVGNQEDARQYLIKYLEFETHHIDSVRMVATIDMRNGDFVGAKRMLARTNVAKPNDPNVLTLLGMSYLELGDPENAQRIFQQVLEMFPSSEIGITNLAKSQLESGQYKTAIDALLAIRNNEVNGYQVKMLLVDSYEKNKNWKGARRILKDLVELFPKSSYLQMRWATVVGRMGDLKLAEEGYTKAVELDSKNVLAIAHLSRIDFSQGNFLEGEHKLTTALETNPDNAFLMSELGAGLVLKGEQEKGLRWLQKAYAIDRSDFLILSRLISGLIKQNEVQRAIDEVDSFISFNPKHVEAFELIASLYQKQRNHKQAILALSEAVEKSPNKSKSLVKLAEAKLQSLDRVGAKQSFKKAIVINDKYMPAYLGLVELVIVDQEENFALSLISSIEQLSGNKSLGFLLKGDLKFRLKQYVEAKKAYHSALKLAPQMKAVLGLYSVHKAENTITEVIPVLRDWLSKRPDTLIVAIALADSLKLANEIQESTKLYESLMQQYGQLPILMNNLANNYFELGKEEKARELASKAYSYLENNVAIIDTLGWIESRMKNHNRALALFRKALTIDYDNPSVKYHLAATLYQLNRHEEAKIYLQEAVESQELFDEQQQAIDLLQKL